MEKYTLPNQLTFMNIKVVFEEIKKCILGHRSVEISFDFVDEPNSVCAALMVACIKLANSKKCKIFFIHVPQGVFVFLEHQELIDTVEKYCC